MARLTEPLYIALRQEWYSELMYRRSGIHVLTTWVSGGAFAAAAWLGHIGFCDTLARKWTVAAVAILTSAIVVGAVWSHKARYLHAARVLVRLNKALGLYGTLLPCTRSTGSSEAEWGKQGLVSWEVILHTAVLYLAFSSLILIACLMPRENATGMVPMPTAEQIGVALGGLLAAYILSIEQVRWRTRLESQEEASLPGIEVGSEE